MKKPYAIVLVLFLFGIWRPAVFAQTTVPSKITSITLFSGQALVERRADATVAKGLNELLIDIDAFQVDTDSVTAKVYGSGETLSVQIRNVPVKDSPQENIRHLEQKIEQLEKSKRILSDEKIRLEKRQRFLDSLIEFSATQVPKDMQTHFPKTEDLSNLLTFIDTSLAKIHQQKQAADSSTEDIDKNIKLLQKELAALQAAVKKQRSVIEILFNAKNAQKITIEAGYLTKNAYWSPVYNVSVPDNLAAVELTMFSKIRQKTGEDWKHVSLSISNVVPLSGTQLPALSSWLLDMPRPLVKKMRKPSAVVLGAAAPDAETADAGALEEGYREKPEAPAAFAAAEKRELPLAFAYDIPRPMDIESQDKETILPLFTKKLNGDFYYYAIPQKSPLTFLVCKAKADKELLSGPLNIYFGGRYVGKTFLTEKKAGDEFRLNLGADRGIKVEKEKIADKIKETFFQTIERGTIIRDFKYKITMENLKNKTVLLEVLDHVPVSRTDKIVVKDVHVTPEPAQRNYLDQEGVMLWQFQLEPKEKQQIEVAFVVTYPKNVLPHGLYP